MMLSYDSNYASEWRHSWLETYTRMHYTGQWGMRSPKRFVFDLNETSPEYSSAWVRRLIPAATMNMQYAWRFLIRSHIIDISYRLAGVPKFILYSKNWQGRKLWMCASPNGAYAYYFAIWGTFTRNDTVHTRSHRVEVGSVWRIGLLPYGTTVCQLEMAPGKGSRIAIHPGTRCVVLGTGRGVFGDKVKDTGDYHFRDVDGVAEPVPVLLPNRTIRLFDPDCNAVVGVNEGIFHRFQWLQRHGLRALTRLSYARGRTMPFGIREVHPRYRRLLSDPYEYGWKYALNPVTGQFKTWLWRTGAHGRRIRTKI